VTSFFDQEQVDKWWLELWAHPNLLRYQALANTAPWETVLHSCYWGCSNEEGKSYVGVVVPHRWFTGCCWKMKLTTQFKLLCLSCTQQDR